MAKQKNNSKPTKKKTKKLSEAELLQRKQQRDQEREIRNVMANIGFKKIDRVDGKQFEYQGRTTELDDIFYYENIIVLTEYTIGDPKDHLLKKNYFYEKVMQNPVEFITYLVDQNIYKDFNDKFENEIEKKYTKKQVQVKIIYCSKQSIANEHKNLVQNVIYFDYHIVKYFESLSKIIKKSSRYEFFDFLNLAFDQIADNIKASSENSNHKFSGHILPEEHSSFKEGYKIVSFYIDAENLLKRAYVLRQNGWRDKKNIGHYQRMFISSKISSMRKYLHDKERVFINNIIATLPIEKIKLYDKQDNLLSIDEKGEININSTKVMATKIEILDEANIIGIIDGQHRTYAYHEGTDIYEETIGKYRGIQNLLVTGILFPKNEREEKKLKFEANLFMEINATQSGASSQLKQEIELMINPFSSISIAKKVLEQLNKSGPLSNLLEQYWYEKNKIKTASIVSYGLKPLLKLDNEKSKDSIYAIWDNSQKSDLKKKNSEEFDLLNDYIQFSVEKIRDILIAFSSKLGKDRWITGNDVDALLSVTTINGILNTLRLIIENNQINTIEEYKKSLDGIEIFKFKSYKSSQYRKMGEDIYKQFFAIQES